MMYFPGALTDEQAAQILRLHKRGYRRITRDLYAGFMFQAWVEATMPYPTRPHGETQRMVSDCTILALVDPYPGWNAIWQAAAIELLFQNAVNEMFHALIQMYLSLYLSVRERP